MRKWCLHYYYKSHYICTIALNQVRFHNHLKIDMYINNHVRFHNRSVSNLSNLGYAGNLCERVPHLFGFLFHISICSVPNKLCECVENPVCKHLFPAQILFSKHHKTGHLLVRKIRAALHQWCQIKYNSFWNDPHRSESDETLDAFFLNSHENLSVLQKLVSPNHSAQTKSTVIFHFVRAPLQTILSGYEFHKKTLSENWLKTDLKRLGTKQGHTSHTSLTAHILQNGTEAIGNSNVTHVFDVMVRNPYVRSKLCYKMPSVFESINWTDSEHYNYSFEYALEMNLKTRGWYRSIDHSDYGIFWEFIRYYNCEWYCMFLSRHFYTALNNINLKYVSFTLDSFFMPRQFRENFNVLLDSLNVRDTHENNRILQRNGFGHINIADYRNSLFRTLQRHTELRNGDTHSTKGSYNKTELKNKLFRVHSSVCRVIKNLTLLMEFEWDQSMLC